MINLSDDDIQYANTNGEIVKQVNHQKLQNDEIRKIIEDCLNSDISTFKWLDEECGAFVYREQQIKCHFKIKNTTYAGNTRKGDEWRVQCTGADLNDLTAFSKAGEPSFLMGSYTVDDITTFQLWYIDKGSSGVNISKYIRIRNIADSFVTGIGRYVDNKGNVSFSVKPGMMLYLLSDYKALFGSDSEKEPDAEPNMLRYNRILFGAPGTGKSFKISSESTVFQNRIERVTFHPNYTYGQFVGMYKPVTKDDKIHYRYTPGPFLRTYINCLKDPSNNYLLIIEEINRANVSAVFGDTFQLLDRSNGISEYPISASEDLKEYLREQLYPNYDELDENEKASADEICRILRLPKNMFIWASMNSSDQGVFPIDAAFKRRWNFEYIGINDGESEVDDRQFTLPDGTMVSWLQLRKAINDKLLSTGVINEDKLLGPFFIKNPSLLSDDEFNDLVKSKVIMYLFEDVSKFNRSDIFSGCENLIYSQICETFDKIGLKIFGDEMP